MPSGVCPIVFAVRYPFVALHARHASSAVGEGGEHRTQRCLGWPHRGHDRHTRAVGRHQAGVAIRQASRTFSNSGSVTQVTQLDMTFSRGRAWEVVSGSVTVVTHPRLRGRVRSNACRCSCVSVCARELQLRARNPFQSRPVRRYPSTRLSTARAARGVRHGHADP